MGRGGGAPTRFLILYFLYFFEDFLYFFILFYAFLYYFEGFLILLQETIDFACTVGYFWWKSLILLVL